MDDHEHGTGPTRASGTSYLPNGGVEGTQETSYKLRHRHISRGEMTSSSID